MNRVQISGNLTRDPELVTTRSGVEMCKFTVAVNENKKVGDEWVEKPHFIDVTYFGRRAVLMTEKAEKGNKVYVDGRLDYSSWETEDGQKRNKVGVVANEVEGEFVFVKSNGSRPARNAAPELPADSPAGPADGDDDDDIPF